MEEKNATEIKDLPEDIVFNILLRLSAETIYNLRYVFNFWSNIITTSYFHDAHLGASKHGLLLSKQREDEMTKSKKRKQPPLLIDTNLINTNNKEELITLREFTAASGDILATCNGFVLFGDDKGGKTELFVTNPATKDLYKLPAHKTGSCLDHIFGMTYIASTGEYKVIHCFIDLVNRSTKNNYCEILTLGCDSWNRVDKFLIRLLQWSSRKFTFINNVAYCLALEDGCESCLVSFDMVEEKFHTTIVPIRLSRIDELCEIEGFPALVNHRKYSKKANGCRFQIWLLKDYDKGNWVRLKKIRLGGRNENVSSVTTPQHGTRIIFLQYDTPSKYYYYITYDVQLKQKRYLDFRQKIPSTSVFPHSESLLSCSNFIADEPYTETCKRRKLL